MIIEANNIAENLSTKAELRDSVSILKSSYLSKEAEMEAL
jgi:hypothetical protein